MMIAPGMENCIFINLLISILGSSTVIANDGGFIVTLRSTFTDAPFTVSLPPNAKVSDLRDRINDRGLVNGTDYFLCFNGQRIGDKEECKAAGIGCEATVDIQDHEPYSPSPSPLHLVIQTIPGNRTFPFEICGAGSSISRTAVSIKRQTPSNSQKIAFLSVGIGCLFIVCLFAYYTFLQ